MESTAVLISIVSVWLATRRSLWHFPFAFASVGFERGRYRSEHALQQSFERALGEAPTPLILNCGGGISAAASALALTLIGEEPGSIYDGSLEEWTADPSLPVSVAAEARSA